MSPAKSRCGPLLNSICFAATVRPMHSDIVDLRSYYSTPLGRLAEHAIAMALSSIWESIPNERLVGLGYTLLWLDRFGVDAGRVFASLPASQGADVWPGHCAVSTPL